MLWPQTQAAVEAAGIDLTATDRAAFHASANARTLLALTLVTAVVVGGGIGLPVALDLGTWALYVGFIGAALPASLVGRGWQLRADQRMASRVRALAAQRRAERAAATTIPALGAAGGAVAVPGLVDERVRGAR